MSLRNGRTDTSSKSSSTSSVTPPPADMHLPWLWILQTTIFTAASLVQYLEAPDSYFSDRTNHLNVFFVKKGWAWTLLPLLAFKTALFLESRCSRDQLVLTLARLGVATGIWWGIVTSMDAIKFWTGKCENPEFAAKHLCLANGHAWDHVDISGHSFLLSFAMFVIWEEISPYFVQGTIRLSRPSSSATSAAPGAADGSSDDSSTIASLSTATGKYSSPLAWMLFAIMWLWMLMLTTTAMYFHTWSEKFAGLFIGQIMWVLAYKVLYPGSRWFRTPSH